MEVEKIFDDTTVMAVLSGLRLRMRFCWSVHEDGPQTYVNSLTELKKYKHGGGDIGSRQSQD